MNNNITIISNPKCWMEHTALQQLDAVAQLPGVTRVVALPDLHAGVTPIGITVETEGVIYPYLIGGDIGCAMSLYGTGVPLRRFKQERFVTRLNRIQSLEGIPAPNLLQEQSPMLHLGTIGGGNHFAELQAIEAIIDTETFQQCGILKDQLLLLVHSGSRDYGQQIRDRWTGQSGIPVNSEAVQDYLADQREALFWAKKNRRVVAEKVLSSLGFQPEVTELLDCAHNYVEERNGLYLHRKGAVSAENGLVVIPGSRGSLTYLVQPTEDTAQSAYSLSHGAGRKWARSVCKGRIQDQYDKVSIHQTKLKSRVICHDANLLYEEAPEAYKNIDTVIAALREHGLIRVVATLRPLITIKV